MDLTVVDSFTDRPFAGNPAAIAVVDALPRRGRMQAIAREMNLSETAFVVARADGSYDLRWFTPTVEVDLCGHATLAAAHVLGGAGTFHTRSGELWSAPGGDGWIEMDFPADPTTADDPPRRRCRRCLGLARRVGGARLHPGPHRPPGRAGRAPTRCARCDPTRRGDRRLGVALCDRHRRRRPPRDRLRQSGVRAQRRHPRGPRHRLGPLHLGGLLGRAPRAATELVGEQASARGGVVRMTRAAATASCSAVGRSPCLQARDLVV